MPYFQDRNDFIFQHNQIETRLDRYLEMYKGERPKDRQADQLRAVHLYADNFTARINFARIAVQHITAGTAGPENLPLHFITIIPMKYAMPAEQAGRFRISNFTSWLKRALKGINFIGMVEWAYYPGWPDGQKTAHLHAHAITFGSSYDKINERLGSIRRRHQSLLPGYPAATTKEIAASEVESEVLYMMKFPSLRYRPYPHKIDFVDPETGVFEKVPTGKMSQNKDPARTGELDLLASIQREQYLDKMIVGGGRGVDLCEGIKKQALAPLRQREASKRH